MTQWEVSTWLYWGPSESLLPYVIYKDIISGFLAAKSVVHCCAWSDGLKGMLAVDSDESIVVVSDFVVSHEHSLLT